MSKKVFWIILIPALLLIGGYVALQIFLRSGTSDREENKQEQLATTQSSEAQSSRSPKAAIADTAAKKMQEPEEKQDSATKSDSTAKEASTEKEKSSPLDLSELFVDKLQQLVKKSSNGLYNLSVGDLDIDLLASTVSLHEVALRPDEQAIQRMQRGGQLPQNVVSLSFEDLHIDGINVDDAINSKSMDYKQIKLVKPRVEISRYKNDNNEGKSSGDFSQGFLQQMEKLAIEKLSVEDGTIVVHDKTKGETKELKNIRVLMQDILLNESTRNDDNRFLFAREAQLEFHDFDMEVENGLYNFRISDAIVNATQRRVELKNVTFGSPLSKEEFVARQEKAKEKYDISLPEVTIDGVEWWPAFNGEAIRAGEVALNGGKIAIYSDRTLPPKNKMGNFPNQMLAKVPLMVDVDKLSVQDLDITYEEYNPKSKQSGTLYVDNIAMDITNITNSENTKGPVEVEATALLMKEVPVKARFTFDMEKAEKGVFAASLHIDSFDATVMNPLAKPLGLTKVSRGEVYSIEANMQGNEHGATGDVLILYDKLKVSLLKKKEGKEDLKKKHLLSFLANVFVIRNNNPWWLTGKTQREEAEMERNPETGFMNLVWKTAFVGILKTAGAPKKIAKRKE